MQNTERMLCQVKNEFGHTFERHGAQQTNNNLLGRAASTNNNQGQWLHNENAANLLKTISPPENGTVVKVEIPDGLGRVITPEGEIIPTNEATVVFKPNGTIRTLFLRYLNKHYAKRNYLNE